MDKENTRALLRLIDELCRDRGEIDPPVLARASGMTAVEAQRTMDELEEAGLIAVNEYGFSCTVETMTEGLTEQGRAFLE